MGGHHSAPFEEVGIELLTDKIKTDGRMRYAELCAMPLGKRNLAIIMLRSRNESSAQTRPQNPAQPDAKRQRSPCLHYKERRLFVFVSSLLSYAL
jgi:hypothetical protein